MKRILLQLFIICITNVIYAQSIDTVNVVSKDSVNISTLNLDEVVVTAPIINKTKNGTSYLITDSIKEKVNSPVDILNHIDGVMYNQIDNTVKVGMDSHVLLLVDGIERGLEYIMALSPDRVAKIEVINIPKAKYTVAGYKYVINYILKKDWIGHDLFVQNFTMLSAGNNNGDNVIANEQPRIQYTYTNKKFDVNLGYVYGDINWNYPISYSKSYANSESMTSNEYSAKNPNVQNSSKAHIVAASGVLNLSPSNLLVWQVDYSRSSDNNKNLFEWKINDSMSHDLYKEMQSDSSSNDKLSTAIIYKAAINEKLKLHSAVGYEYLNQNINYDYSMLNSYNSRNSYKNIKDYIRGELDITYSNSEFWSINMGYIATWNRYKSKSIVGNKTVSEITDQRHQVYMYFDYTPNRYWLLHIGSGAEFIGNTNINRYRSYWNWLPQVSLSYTPSDKIQIVLDYSTKMEYPKMYQISNTYYNIDKWSIYRGNSNLSPGRTHSLSLQGAFWHSFLVNIEYYNNRGYITDMYGKDENDVVKTNVNANSYSFIGSLSYDWKISDNLTWRNIAQISFDKIYYKDFSNDYTNWALVSQLNYWVKPIQMLFSATYQRSMTKEPLLQGWGEVGQDFWQLSLQKQLWNRRIYVSLSYIPPVHIGTRTMQRSCVSTEYYNYFQKQSLKTYDNLLLLRIQLRFSNGKKKQQVNANFRFDNEKIKDRGLL